jgi:pimeloyl-ACP methyl ester carboxylesterase
VLAEPGGELDPTLAPAGAASGPSPLAARMPMAAEKVKNGDIDGALALFFDMIEGDGAWRRLPAAPKQQLRDNVFTLIGQVGEDRKPYARSEAEAIRTPTLLIGGGDTKGSLATNWRVLAQHIPGARTAVVADAGHWMFEQAPQEFSEIVQAFLAD